MGFCVRVAGENGEARELRRARGGGEASFFEARCCCEFIMHNETLREKKFEGEWLGELMDMPRERMIQFFFGWGMMNLLVSNLKVYSLVPCR